MQLLQQCSTVGKFCLRATEYLSALCHRLLTTERPYLTGICNFDSGHSNIQLFTGASKLATLHSLFSDTQALFVPVHSSFHIAQPIFQVTQLVV